jgi:hypothetical protein
MIGLTMEMSTPGSYVCPVNTAASGCCKAGDMGLVKQAPVAAERPRARAPYSVSEHGNGRRIACDGQIMVAQLTVRTAARIVSPYVHFAGFSLAGPLEAGPQSF